MQLTLLAYEAILLDTSGPVPVEVVFSAELDATHASLRDKLRVVLGVDVSDTIPPSAGVVLGLDAADPETRVSVDVQKAFQKLL